MSSQNQLALVSPQQQQQAIVLATTTRQDARTLRPDDFEIASQPELLEMFIAVACHLNTLQFCHSGRHRFQVLTTPFIRDSFQSALACIRSTVPDETGRLHMANEDLSLDMWYFNQLPDSVKARADPTLNDIQNASATEHEVDWFTALKRLNDRYPGIVAALHTSIQSQIKIVDKTREAFNYALNYSRGQEGAAAPRMGERILKGTSAPSAASSGGHRMIGV